MYADAEDETSLHENIADEAIFQMDNFDDWDLTKTMAHEVAEVLDVCLEKLFEWMNLSEIVKCATGLINTSNGVIVFAQIFHLGIS